MAMVKVRRNGNSLVVTIPAELARNAHLQKGSYVNIEVDPVSGGVRIEPVSIQPRVRSKVISAGRMIMEKKRGLYESLTQE